MAGKRKTSSLDYVMHNKLSRVEVAPQYSITCPGKTAPKDLQASKNYRTYSLSGTEGQISSSHWSSATMYQQHAGNTFNQHLQTNGALEKYQRPEVEMLHNPLQQSDNVITNYSVHQNHPVPSYHMSPPRAYPPIVMPRPVYRSTGGFMDAAYGTMGVSVGSQPLCPPAAIEWRPSTGFAYPSSSYASGVNKPFSTPNDCPEVANSPSSLLRGFQEQSLAHTHRVDMNLAVGVSPTCPKEDVYTGNCHSFTPPNVQLLYAEDTTPVVRQRNSAFNMSSYQPQSYKPGSQDNRMEHLYSKSNYSNRVDGIHQRSFPCSIDIASSTHGIRGGTIYPSNVPKMQTGFVNTELTVSRSHTDGNLQKNDIWTQRALQIGRTKTCAELKCSDQRDNDLWVGSSVINRELSVGSTRVDGERQFDTTQTSNCLEERSVYGGQFDEQSAHVAFLRQNSSSNSMPDVSINGMMANRLIGESPMTSKMSALQSSFISFEGIDVTDVKLTEQTSHMPKNRANINTQYAKSTILMPGIASQYQNTDDSMKVEPPSVLLEPNRDLSVTNMLDVDEPKSPPVPLNKDVDVDGPKSPPMPVINDVFSLAPYCAYLEGKANHIPMQQDWDVKNKISTSIFSQQSLSPDRTEQDGKELVGNTTKVNIAECPQSVKNQQIESLQTGEPQGVSYHQTDGETVVLDLSLKKSPQASSPCNKDLPYHGKEIIDNCLPKPSERMFHVKSQEVCRPGVARRISQPCLENSPSQATSRLFYPDQDSCPSTKSNLNKCSEMFLSQATDTQPRRLQDSCPSQAAMCLPHQLQESYPFQSAGSLSHQLHHYQSKASDSLATQLLGSYPLQVTGSLHNQFQKNYSYQATNSMPCKLQENSSSKAPKSMNLQIQEHAKPIQEDYLSQAPKCINRQIKENYPSQTPQIMPSQLQENYSSQAPKNMPCQIQEDYPSQAPKSMSHQFQANYPSQAPKIMPSQFQQDYPSQAAKNIPHQLQRNYKSQAMEGLSHQIRHNLSLTKENMTDHDQSRSMSKISTALPVDSSPQHSNLSVFVNNIQTSITFLPQTVMLASPPPAFSAKNLNLHSPQPHQSIESPGRRARSLLGTCRSTSSPSESDNEANGFHSSKSFMFRKYKLMKFSSSAGEPRGVVSDSSTCVLPSSFPLPSNTVQSLPPSAPESSPTLGESNVSLASVGELALNGSRQQFSELHRSVRVAITSSVDRSPSSLLEDWMAKTKEEEKTKMPVKNKNGSRSFDHSADSPSHDIWLAFEGVRLLLHKLLSQLETFMFTRSCPFPHVIRAGAIFIPIYLVKEVLFPELLGPPVDRILQKHKVELRPTTLSEEKLLRETELKDCPSRMLKLLALKQLPDMYPDLLNLFCGHSMQQQLDKCSKKRIEKGEWQKINSSHQEPQIDPLKKSKTSLILKLQRVFKHSGNHVYKAQRLRPLNKGEAEKLQKKSVCRKKSYRQRTMFTYKRRKRSRRNCNSSKGFPDLVGRRIRHLFDDGDREVWFSGKVLRVHQRSRNPRDTQYEVWYDDEPGTRYFLELLQDYEKGWLQLDS